MLNLWEGTWETYINGISIVYVTEHGKPEIRATHDFLLMF